jgi:hypothetical protein
MATKIIGASAAAILVGCTVGEGDDGSEMGTISPVLAVVHEQMDAFNRQDVDAMAERVAPDFVWFSVEDDEVTVEVRGRAALAEGMRSYFESFPSVRSEVESSLVSERFAVVRERARWTDESGEERTQVSLGVYEIRNGRIQRVWYYPAEN